MEQIDDIDRAILRMLSVGARQSDIAVLLGLKPQTVKNRLVAIRARLRAKTTCQAVVKFVRAYK